MADNIKIIGNVNNIQRVSRFKTVDTKLLSTNNIPQSFGYAGDFIELFLYDINNNVLSVNYNYTDFKLPADQFLYPDATLPIIQIDPSQDVQNIGYNNGLFKSQYSFFRRKFSLSNDDLFISEISQDRTEVRVNSINLSSTELVQEAQKLIDELTSSTYQKYYVINYNIDIQQIVINVAIDNTTDVPSILFKLYEPLSESAFENGTLWITEDITEPYIFNINLDLSVIPESLPQLRGPNFDIDIDIKQNIATKYENYSSLVTSLTGSSYQKVLNYMNDDSYDLNVNYTLFDNFIHFSSAEKRLGVFYDKVKQIEDYNNNINLLIKSTSSLKNPEITSIKLKINNLVTNFDGFEKYLYFESSSHTWPKLENNKPYSLLPIGSTISVNWYSTSIISASKYDNNNLDYLYNIIPEYIKNDPSNYQPYYTFIDMIGHYFDNIWIYITSINELYNADNNAEKGISKDIVYDALKSLGVKLYNSKGDTNFANYIGGSDSGSILFDNNFSHTSSFLNNIPKKDLLAETYKRIYHNLILLNKNKGTVNGLQNLITTFGIDSSIFEPKEFGGSTKINEIKGYDNNKITIQDNNIAGSVLSPFISLQQSPTGSDTFTSTDLHFIDLSFSPQNQLNSRISSSIAVLAPTFSIDDYIGDPKYYSSSSYSDLNIQKDYFISASAAISGSATRLDYKGFFELVKYFDNSLFKMLKDFIPARANALTGITIKSPVLERNKIITYRPNVTKQTVYDAEFNGPTISEDSNYIYDKLTGTKSSFYNGDITGSYINTYDYFIKSNPNPYLLPNSPIDVNKFNHNDFNITLNNISSSVNSITRYKLEDTYTNIDKYIFKTSLPYSSSAELQDSYNSLLGHSRSRYDGIKLSSINYNIYTPISSNYEGDVSYGKTAVIDHNTRKIGLFTQITDNKFLPSSKKNNVVLRYLVDESGNLTELNRNNQHWHELQNIFKSGDNLTVTLFNNQKNGDQKSTDGSKLIFNSGYNYSPMLYFTGSESNIYFEYTGENIGKLFQAKNIMATPLNSSGYIYGGPGGINRYQLNPSGSYAEKVIHNIFDIIESNDGGSFTAGDSTSTPKLYPTYTVPAKGSYTFSSQFDIYIDLKSSEKEISFKYEVIKGKLIDNHPTGDIIGSPVIKTLSSSYRSQVINMGSTFTKSGNVVIKQFNRIELPDNYFPLTIVNSISNGPNITLISTSHLPPFNIRGNNNKVYFLSVIEWDTTYGGNHTVNSKHLVLGEINNASVYREGLSDNDYILSEESITEFSPNSTGTLSFDFTTPEIILSENEKIYFKLTKESNLTNFTASFSTTGKLRNNLISTTYGDFVSAVGSANNHLISSSINNNTIVFNDSLTKLENYKFVAEQGTGDNTKLYTNYGYVDEVFLPSIGDVVVMYWGGKSQNIELTIGSLGYFNNKRTITFTTNLPSSLIFQLNDSSSGNTLNGGVDIFLLLKKKPDETNIILKLNKRSGTTSLGLVIPSNIHPSVLNNIDVITKEVKQKLIDLGTADAGGVF